MLCEIGTTTAPSNLLQCVERMLRQLAMSEACPQETEIVICSTLHQPPLERHPRKCLPEHQLCCFFVRCQLIPHDQSLLHVKQWSCKLVVGKNWHTSAPDISDASASNSSPLNLNLLCVVLVVNTICVRLLLVPSFDFFAQPHGSGGIG